MALRAAGLRWLAVLFAVIVFGLLAAPLVAQDRDRLEVGTNRIETNRSQTNRSQTNIGQTNIFKTNRGQTNRVVANKVEAKSVEAAGEGKPSTDLSSPADVSSSSTGLPGTADAVIEEMARAAGAIFVGRVSAVRLPVGYTESAEGVVEVDFLVDQAIRGPASGTVYTLREWSGLWSASGGTGRYRVGQRLLVFLYAPDSHGLSSPVRGRDGGIPLRGNGVSPGPDDATAAAAEWMVDLRWVQTQALRRSAVASLPVRMPVLPRPVHGIMPEEIVRQAGIGGESSLVRIATFPPPAPVATPVQMQPLAQVIGLCLQAAERSNAIR